VISLQGGCIAPCAPNENIRLDVMRVTFRSKRDTYSVDARYNLFNTGETTTVTVGVPKFGRPDRGQEQSRHGFEPLVRDFIGFDAWVNGRKAEFVEVGDFFTDPGARPVGGYCRQRNELTETRWMVKRVTFTGNATTFIRVRYEAFYHNHFWMSGQLIDYGRYHDSVGRYWKDKINRAFFVTDTADINSFTELDFAALHHGIQRVAAFMDFISVDEVRQWEPSPRSFRRIPGSYEAAQWKRIGTRYHRLPSGAKHPAAPTPCARCRGCRKEKKR
jgi:hypothetical protein